MSLRIAFCAVLISQAGLAENLAGLVTSTDGQPVAAALVSAIGTSAVPWSNVRTSSGANGTFSFSGLTPGVYRLCVQVLSGGYLNPCQWSLVPPTVTLRTGASISGFALKVETGSILRVRVNDPRNLVGTGPGFEVLMGAHTQSGLFEQTILRSTNGTGMDHDVTIPFDTTVKFSIRGNKLQIAQEDGSPLADGAVLPILRTRGQGTPRQLVLNITGVRP